MKKIKVGFEKDEKLDCIEITIKASERDRLVDELIFTLEMSGRRLITVNEENNSVRTIPVDDIVIISVNGKMLSIVTENESFFLRRSLQSIESCLDDTRFIRISRYEIVNISKVARYDFTFRGALRMEFCNGTEAWASRRCIPAIRKLLSGKE